MAEHWEGGSPFVFLVGLVVFLGSILLFLADLLRGIDILRSIAINAIGAFLLIAWAAHDTLSDPESEVATAGGAAGTALLLYGLYLLIAGVAVAGTSFFHGRLRLGIGYVGLSLAAIVLGFFIFPTEAVIEERDEEPGKTPAGDGETTDGNEENNSKSDEKPATDT